MISEAHHYTLFLKLARKYSDEKEKVDDKWKSLLEFEAELIKNLGIKNLFMANLITALIHNTIL